MFLLKIMPATTQKLQTYCGLHQINDIKKDVFLSLCQVVNLTCFEVEFQLFASLNRSYQLATFFEVAVQYRLLECSPGLWKTSA